MTFPSLTPFKSACLIVAGVAGGWTLQGILSTLASLMAFIVGCMHAYDWIQRKRRERQESPPKA